MALQARVKRDGSLLDLPAYRAADTVVLCDTGLVSSLFLNSAILLFWNFSQFIFGYLVNMKNTSPY
ncbi:hypothetical protein, partial [Endozoicomonas sp. SESOKO2]|uniref:hypothetical protein n=1 Tax=Endozoicomonas sp. SESOKO2 TaxID=2828743 RepID=UPI0021486990